MTSTIKRRTRGRKRTVLALGLALSSSALSQAPGQVRLTYLGNAGWEITDRRTVTVAATLDSAIVAVRDSAGQVSDLYGLTGVPEAILVDSAGRVLLRIVGLGLPSSLALRALLAQHLRPPA